MANYVDPRIISISDAMSYVLGSNAKMKDWWLTKNQDLDNQTPKNMFKTDPSRVSHYVMGLLTEK